MTGFCPSRCCRPLTATPCGCLPPRPGDTIPYTRTGSSPPRAPCRDRISSTDVYPSCASGAAPDREISVSRTTDKRLVVRFRNLKKMVKYRTLVLLGICSVASTGCVAQPTVSSRPAVTWTMDSATASEKRMAKEMVTSQLKDPESARFGEIWALKGSNGHKCVCGYVNAKNSFGGYTGKKMFTLLDKRAMFEDEAVLGDLLPGICMPRTVR